MIVHVQTIIQSVFGLLDDDGNVIPQQPVVVSVSLFKPEAFQEAYVAIEGARNQAAANMPPDDPQAAGIGTGTETGSAAPPMATAGAPRS